MKEKKQDDHRVSVRELAGALRVSTDTVRRAFRKGEIPAIRVGTALRFDLDEVHRCLQRNAEAVYGTKPGAPGGTAGRAQRHQPPACKTGALIPGT